MYSLIAYFYLLYYFCSLVTYSLATTACITSLSAYGLTNIIVMPVTTRSRAKLLSKVKIGISRTLSSDPTIIGDSSNNNITTHTSTSHQYTGDEITTTNLPILDDFYTITSTNQDHHHLELQSSSLVPTDFEVSKFQNSSSLILPTTMTDCHNYSFSKIFDMEADCQDTKLLINYSSSDLGYMDQILQLFASLSAQIENRTTSMSQDFRQVVQDNQIFKQEMCAEMDELRQLLYHPKLSSPLPGLSDSMVPPLPEPSAMQPPSSSQNMQPPSRSGFHQVSQGSMSTSASLNSNPDLQTQMMYMLPESFSKLSSALSEKSSELKSHWPKFSGDVKKLRPWYLAIIAQISLPPWQEYDSTKHDIVSTTSNIPIIIGSRNFYKNCWMVKK